MTQPETVQSFAAAVRAVLLSTPDRDDMRAVARKALGILSPDAAMEAAVTYLAGVARQEHNRQVREESRHGASAEVVNVKGQDLLLGQTSQADRDFLISRGESLAAGLQRRADQIRELGATGPTAVPDPAGVPELSPAAVGVGSGTVSVRVISGRELHEAERRAAATEAMAASLAALLTGRGTPDGSVLEQQLAAEAERLAGDLAQERARTARYDQLAHNLIEADYGQSEVDANGRAVFAKTRRTVRRMAETFGIELSEAS